MTKKHLILASCSPRRKRLFKNVSKSFRVVAPQKHVEKEFSIAPEKHPSGFVVRQAIKKAKNVARRVSHGVVVGADTVVYFKGHIYGKPKNLKIAKKILDELSGHRHTVYTGVAVFNVDKNFLCADYEKSYVWIRRLDARRIHDYFQKINPKDKAGAYAIQEYGSDVVDRFTGSRDNIIGLPVKLVKKLIQKSQ